ncbi:MAG: gamma-glutamyltransferase [Caldilineaceae bacterium]
MVYYRGEIADQIVNFCQANGGLLTKEDMADLCLQECGVEPLGIRYLDFAVYGLAALESAMQWLQTLKLLEGYDLPALGHNSVDHLYTLLEVEKLAIADRIHYNVRPRCRWRLLSDEYCGERRKLVDAQRWRGLAAHAYATTMEVNVKPGDLGLREEHDPLQRG